MDDNKNTILAIVLSLVILLAWQYFVAMPKVEKERLTQQAIEQAQQQAPAGQTAPGSSPPTTGQSAPPSAGGAPQPAIQQATAPVGMSRDGALGASPRLPINTPQLGGSIALKGGRIDDIILKGFHETVDPKSAPIVLFSPSGSPTPYYAEFGWAAGAGDKPALPSSETMWQAEGNTTLTPSSPVTLVHDNGAGLIFRRTYSVDDSYMFSIAQSVENRSGNPVTLHPYALISRQGTPHTQGYYVLHEGVIGVIGDEGLQEVKYKDILKSRLMNFEATGGWLGFTDKYWAAALVPDQTAPFKARMSATPRDSEDDGNYQTDYLLDARTVAPGASLTVASHLFAGAKEVHVVDGYEKSLGIKKFELLIDWGWFYFFTKPLFFAIDYFYRLVGNFGIAILIVTVLVKTAFFPLANKSYVSMSRMKKVQPEVAQLRERFKDDRAKQQQAMMELYKKEKINPMSGCVPVVLQVPVFFALYKVLFVTIEMRHAPFFGWIQDLAAPDPTSLFNLFGLIPFDPPQFLMIGVWPLIMGVTMFLQMRLNPPPPDPTQAMIFNWMPLFFTFLLASFPAGLVIYWAWNNSLSIMQQYLIMRRQGVKVELWNNIRAMFGKKANAKSAE